MWQNIQSSVLMSPWIMSVRIMDQHISLELQTIHRFSQSWRRSLLELWAFSQIVCSSNYGSSHFTFPPNCIIFVKISKNIQMLEKCGLMKPRTPQFRLLFENLIVDPATAKHGTISPADQCNKLEHLNIATWIVLEYSFPLKSLFKI